MEDVRWKKEVKVSRCWTENIMMSDTSSLHSSQSLTFGPTDWRLIPV